MFQRASLAPPARIVETAALLFITRLLEESDMIAVLAADVAQYYAAHRVVEILPLAMQCQMDDYGLITRSDRLPTPAAAIVTDALRAAGGLLSGN